MIIENRKMFTTGKLIFALIFVLVFIGTMIWSYQKDKVFTKTHYPKPYKLLLFIGLVVFIMFLFVKMRHKL